MCRLKEGGLAGFGDVCALARGGGGRARAVAVFPGISGRTEEERSGVGGLRGKDIESARGCGGGFVDEMGWGGRSVCGTAA